MKTSEIKIEHDIITDAVTAACSSLDEHFPGKNKGGITDQFAGKLHKHIEKLLREDNLIK
jgi:hypothetical protein